MSNRKTNCVAATRVAALSSRVRLRPLLLDVASGRQVAVEEFGDPKGVPIFFFHGWPSSRTMAQLTDDAAKELNVRIISLDRPGIRDSSLQRNRTLLDWPPLMQEVAEQLQIQRYRILAVSGGAPYAYAIAWASSESVIAIAVASGAPPIAEMKDRSGLLPLYNRMLALQQRNPRLLRVLFHIARPFAASRLPRGVRPLFLKILQ